MIMIQVQIQMINSSMKKKLCIKNKLVLNQNLATKKIKILAQI